MCHQTVGLVQKICEENNIICSTISIIDEITIKLKTKRYISVPYQLGYPLGPIGDYNQQKNTTKKLLYERALPWCCSACGIPREEGASPFTTKACW